MLAGRMPRGVNRLRLAAASAMVVLAVYGHSLSGEHVIQAASAMVRLTIQTALARSGG
jgi:hypothetical protein